MHREILASVNAVWLLPTLPVQHPAFSHLQVAALFERVDREEGRLDVLVNAAWGGNEVHSRAPVLLHRGRIASSDFAAFTAPNYYSAVSWFQVPGMLSNWAAPCWEVDAAAYWESMFQAGVRSALMGEPWGGKCSRSSWQRCWQSLASRAVGCWRAGCCGPLCVASTHAARAMAKQRSGLIVNVSFSTAADGGGPSDRYLGNLFYDLSKAALNRQAGQRLLHHLLSRYSSFATALCCHHRHRHQRPACLPLLPLPQAGCRPRC